MKTVDWGKCKNNGTMDTLDPCSKIITGMQVSARYGNSDVYMDITDDTKDDIFLAVIKFFEPVNIDPPKDLAVGDIVQINRENICWVFIG
jgi:hypothetical protein